MADPQKPQAEKSAKRSRKPLLAGLILAFALGGAGFYLSRAGLIPARLTDLFGKTAVSTADTSAISFVPVDTVVVSLGPAKANRHLKLTVQLEVAPDHTAEVTHLMPRILDVMNAYLRAVDTAELQEPAALIRVRTHLLRRIQTVTGDGRVNDLLITEFILNCMGATWV